MRICSLGNAKLFSHVPRPIWREEGWPTAFTASGDWGSQSSFPRSATSCKSCFLLLLWYRICTVGETMLTVILYLPGYL